jgi:hypothetical protein
MACGCQGISGENEKQSLQKPKIYFEKQEKQGRIHE